MAAANACLAFDVIKYPDPQVNNEILNEHKLAVLDTALKLTEETYGGYTIVAKSPYMSRHRAIEALKDGQLLDVYITIPRPEDKKDNAIVIPIPLRRGALSYRLLLIHEQDRNLFDTVKTVDDLKLFSVGSIKTAATLQLFQLNGFSTVPGDNYEAPFRMLNNRRFGFFPRGAHEIFIEFNARHEKMPNLMIHPTLAIYLPSSAFIYVSPQKPKLAERITKGVQMMVANGQLRELFNTHVLPEILKADLPHRHIIAIDNPYLSDNPFKDNPELWFNPSELTTDE